MAERFLDGTTVTADSTSVITTFELLATTTNIAVTGATKDTCCASYWRAGAAAPVSIVLTNLATVGAAYSSGGMIELGATSMCGRYRIDTPNAMWASNVDFVELQVWAPGAKPDTKRYAITGGKTIANCVLNQIVEDCGRYTLQQSQSVILSTTSGMSSTSGTVRMTPNGCATRATATIDGSNNRTAVTLTPSAGL
jgi:hypothetical protein